MTNLHVLKVKEMDCFSEYNLYSDFKTARGFGLPSKS